MKFLVKQLNALWLLGLWFSTLVLFKDYILMDFFIDYRYFHLGIGVHLIKMLISNGMSSIIVWNCLRTCLPIQVGMELVTLEIFIENLSRLQNNWLK